MHWHRCTEQNLRWTLKPPAARRLAGTMGPWENFVSSRSSLGRVFSPMVTGFFSKVLASACFGEPCDLYKFKPPFFEGGAYRRWGIRSWNRRIICRASDNLEGCRTGGSKMTLVKINTKLLPLGLLQGIVMFLFNFFTQNHDLFWRVSMLKGLAFFVYEIVVTVRGLETRHVKVDLIVCPWELLENFFGAKIWLEGSQPIQRIPRHK